MKKILLLIIVGIAIVSSAMARNEHVYVYRNDKTFNYLKGSEIESIQYEGEVANGFSLVKITDVKGDKIVIPADAVDSISVATTALPEIHVNLQDHPKWTELYGAKRDVHPASLYIVGNGMMDDLEEQTVEFRGRGNSTWYMAKKPYRFKMEKKTSLAGMKKAKTYALIANYIDCSMMHNAIALWTANWLGMPYSNHFIPVRVYFNGILKGAYMMTEKIGIGGASVDIDEDKGVLFELDVSYDEDFKFVFNLNDFTINHPEIYTITSNLLPVMIKDPDFFEIAEKSGFTPNEYFELWEEDFSRMIRAVMTQSDELVNILDFESIADYLIVNSLANNHEINHPKSVYLYKKDREAESKYTFGPVWDFDWAFTLNASNGKFMEYANPACPVLWGGEGCSGTLFYRKIVSNPAFMEIYKERWQRFVEEGYPELLKFMDEYADMIEPAAKENGVIWDFEGNDSGLISTFEFRKNYETLKKWIAERIEYCNKHVKYGLAD